MHAHARTHTHTHTHTHTQEPTNTPTAAPFLQARGSPETTDAYLYHREHTDFSKENIF